MLQVKELKEYTIYKPFVQIIRSGSLPALSVLKIYVEGEQILASREEFYALLRQAGLRIRSENEEGRITAVVDTHRPETFCKIKSENRDFTKFSLCYFAGDSLRNRAYAIFL